VLYSSGILPLLGTQVRTLKRITTLFFLLLYLSSSFVTSQYRSGRIAQRILRATAGNDVQVKDWTSSTDNYPRFREAKKVGFDFGFRPAVAVNLVPQAGTREFTLFQIDWKAHDSLRIAADRAPPLQA
jgi:hypothetical protein